MARKLTEKKASINYYISLRDRFSLWDNNAETHETGQALYNKETHVFWGPKTCKENGIDFTLFRNGQLWYRAENNNAEY